MRNKNGGRRVASLVRQYGEPLFKSVFDVFGTYTWGKLEGKTNPKALATVTMFGDDFKDCKSKLNHQTDGAFFKPVEIIDLNPAYSRAYEDREAALKAVTKALVERLSAKPEPEVEAVS